MNQPLQANGTSLHASIGRILAVDGSRAMVRLDPVVASPDGTDAVTIGKFLAIGTGQSLVIGVVTEIAGKGDPSAPGGVPSEARVDLLGEIAVSDGKGRFQRGISSYPVVGSPVARVTADDLRLVYDLAGPKTINIGRLAQDPTIGAYVHVEDMLCKHFAVLGTTGVGKSSGVAVIMNEVLNAKPDLRVLMIDPHNEYGGCFGDKAEIINPKNLRLPFWLFNFEETVDVFYRGRPGVEEEVAILSEMIPIAKQRFAMASRGDRPSLRKANGGPGFTPDTPVPYRLQELVGLIDERMGKLENRSAVTKYHRLLTRIETVRNDPRYAFMFDNANVGGDTMAEVISRLFRLDGDNRPMTVIPLAGFPAEVVDSLVSVLCRMAFEFGQWSEGAAPLLVVCEEAHRYAPADRSIGFGPTRKAVSRIAKEGRKYGVYIALVTQRPAELDATIISQCSTLFVMRMANDRDQAIVKSAVSDAAASLLSFVPALGTREVFAFGEGVALPTRLRFKELPRHLLPKGESLINLRFDPKNGVDRTFIDAVIERWRGATMSKSSIVSSNEEEFDSLGLDPTLVESSLGRPVETRAPEADPRMAPRPPRAPEAPTRPAQPQEPALEPRRMTFGQNDRWGRR